MMHTGYEYIYKLNMCNSIEELLNHLSISNRGKKTIEIKYFPQLNSVSINNDGTNVEVDVEGLAYTEFVEKVMNVGLELFK